MKVAINLQNPNMYSAPGNIGAKSAPAKAYEAFYNKTVNIVNNNYVLDVNAVCDWFYKIAYNFDKTGSVDEFTKLSKGLIEFLVSKKLDNMAGIICSILIKFNEKNQNWKNMEDLAIRGVAIARRADDIVHLAARANDINILLREKEPGSDKHIKYLKIQNDALEDICKNYYSDIIKNRETNSRELAPLENYIRTLFYVKLDIAAFALLKEPKYAREQFEQAKKLYKEIKDQYWPNVSYKLEKRMDDINKKMQSLRIVV